MYLKITNEVFIADLITSSCVLMLERWMLPFSYIQHPTVLLVRDMVHEDQEWVFSWFQYEFICPNVRALNSTISLHSTPNCILVEKYCVWRWQMSCLGDLNTSSYVLMLECWMLPCSYIQRQRLLLVRDIVY